MVSGSVICACIAITIISAMFPGLGDSIMAHPRLSEALTIGWQVCNVGPWMIWMCLLVHFSATLQLVQLVRKQNI